MWEISAMNRKVAALTLLGTIYATTTLLLAAQSKAAPERLSAAAQQAFHQGLAAARQRQWNAAIMDFAEAQQSAETNPQLLFNLGHAHGMAGHSLTGIVWLRAYLAAAPQGPNAARARSEISRLQAANRASMARIISQAVSRAMKTEDKIKRKWLLGIICTAQAKSGDIEGALKLLPEFRALGGTMNQSDVWKDYLVSKAEAGQVRVAREGLYHLRTNIAGGSTVASIDLDNQVAVLLAVYQYQKNAGEWDDARATILALPNSGISAETRKRFFTQIDDSKKELERNRQAEAANGCCGFNLALTEWIARTADFAAYGKSVCGIDLDLQAAIDKATIPSADIDEASENLTDLVNTLANCRNAVQALDAKLAWQANHSRTQ